MRLIKITDIKESDLPLIVLSDDRRGFMAWLIKAHSSGNYGHVMEMHKTTHFASQGMSGFKEILVKQYLKPYITLKFWQYKDMTQEQKKEWNEDLQLELNEPWWKRRYDFLGIIGQALPFRWTRRINNPWTKYCSERIRNRVIKILEIYFMPHSTPSEINQEFRKNPRMEVFGHIMED